MSETLLEETEQVLKVNGKSPSDVLWVGSRDGEWSTSWGNFAAIANKEYNNGYGAAEVNESLVVVGANWWLERGEYDGSEWWEFKTTPTRKVHAKPISNVFVVDYDETWEATRPS